MRKGKLMTSMKSLFIGPLVVLLALPIVLPLPAAVIAADSYPTKPIKLVVPFAPGGGGSAVGGILATKLDERLGKRIVLDFRGGGGGTIGIDAVAKSEPDGYTLLLTSGAFVFNPLLDQVPYDPVKSFVPIARVSTGPAALSAHPSVPVNSVKELIALAKKQPGKLTFAAAGSGSTTHLISELFKQMAGIDIMIVQFKGAGPAMVDMLGGHSNFSFVSVQVALPQIKAGKLKVLGTGGSVRSKPLLDVPTISEAGVPGFEGTMWWGILAPAGTPNAVVDRLYKELAVIMKMEDVNKILESQGAEADLMNQAEFAKFIEAETARWRKVIKEGNIKAES